MSKPGGRSLVRGLARHRTLTTVRAHSTWPPRSQHVGHGHLSVGTLPSWDPNLPSRWRAPLHGPCPPPNMPEGPDLGPTGESRALWSCWWPAGLGLHERQHGLGKSLAREAGILGPRTGSFTAPSTTLHLNVFIYKKGIKPSLLPFLVYLKN